ncbi:hypothetical protein [Streptomyces sp. NRRL S-448]
MNRLVLLACAALAAVAALIGATGTHAAVTAADAVEPHVVVYSAGWQ